MRSSWPLLLACAAACSEYPLPPRPVDPSQAFYSLSVQPRGITVAVGGTQQLTVVPLNGANAPLSVSSSPVLTSTDTTLATVSASGLLTGVRPSPDGSPVLIVTTLQASGVTRADTEYVAVTADAHTITSFSLQQSTSTVVNAEGSFQIVPTVVDASDDTLTNLSIQYSGDPRKVFVSPVPQGALFFDDMPGPVWVYGTTTSYGKTFRDSVLFTVINLASHEYDFRTTGSTLLLQGQYQSIALAPQGTLTYCNNDPTITLTITFSDPSAALSFQGGDSGNIAPFTGSFFGGFLCQTREFDTPGNYTWTTVNNPGGDYSGRIVVH